MTIICNVKDLEASFPQRSCTLDYLERGISGQGNNNKQEAGFVRTDTTIQSSIDTMKIEGGGGRVNQNHGLIARNKQHACSISPNLTLPYLSDEHYCPLNTQNSLSPSDISLNITYIVLGLVISTA